MRRYVRWADEGYLSSNGECFDIGNTVSHALSHFRRTGEAIAGSTHPETAGNGSLMRLAPVPMFYADDARAAVTRAAESSRTTHGAREAVDACRYFAGLLTAALAGADKETLLRSGYSPVEGLWDSGTAGREGRRRRERLVQASGTAGHQGHRLRRGIPGSRVVGLPQDGVLPRGCPRGG